MADTGSYGKRSQVLATYIFVTKEGHTYQPSSNAIEPDIDNLQVLGFASGIDEAAAFSNLLTENALLLDSKFDALECLELRHEDYDRHIRRFSLEEIRTDTLR
jgi:hypothetical protein